MTQVDRPPEPRDAVDRLRALPTPDRDFALKANLPDGMWIDLRLSGVTSEGLALVREWIELVGRAALAALEAGARE